MAHRQQRQKLGLAILSVYMKNLIRTVTAVPTGVKDLGATVKKVGLEFFPHFFVANRVQGCRADAATESGFASSPPWKLLFASDWPASPPPGRSWVQGGCWGRWCSWAHGWCCHCCRPAATHPPTDLIGRERTETEDVSKTKKERKGKIYLYISKKKTI